MKKIFAIIITLIIVFSCTSCSYKEQIVELESIKSEVQAKESTLHKEVTEIEKVYENIVSTQREVLDENKQIKDGIKKHEEEIIPELEKKMPKDDLGITIDEFQMYFMECIKELKQEVGDWVEYKILNPNNIIVADGLTMNSYMFSTNENIIIMTISYNTETSNIKMLQLDYFDAKEKDVIETFEKYFNVMAGAYIMCVEDGEFDKETLDKKTGEFLETNLYDETGVEIHRMYYSESGKAIID